MKSRNSIDTSTFEVKRTRVLLIQNVISQYRVPVLNVLSKEYDLVVMHSNKTDQKYEFKTYYVPIKRLWKFYIHDIRFSDLCNCFDVVISEFNIGSLSLASLLSNRFRRTKVILWGIGVPASYNVRFDEKRRLDWIYKSMILKSDATIFYSDYPCIKWKAKGVPREKMFVAYNTVQVDCSEYKSEGRNSILFVGSLYRQKGVGELLVAYKHALVKEPTIADLYIIGGGEEYEKVNEWIINNGLSDRIHLEGEIFDEKQLKEYFRNALLCVSPNQAGLSVQKSMGYGVPYVTKVDAITGGERFDIINGFNGILYKDNNDLVNILIDTIKKKDMFVEMGNISYVFYQKKRRIEDMVCGFKEAISFVLEK